MMTTRRMVPPRLIPLGVACTRAASATNSDRILLSASVYAIDLVGSGKNAAATCDRNPAGLYLRAHEPLPRR